MINSNTLKQLNRLGFGLDVDRLETYLFDYKKASRLSDMTKYSYNYSLLKSILHDIKPSSPALKEISLIERIPLDVYDKYFKIYKNKRVVNIYGSSDSGIESIKDALYGGTDKAYDIVAIVNVEGIDISVVYSYGELMGIYAISEEDKLIELTDKLGYKLPDYIDELHEEDVVELRGKLTILNKNDIVNNAICDTYSFMRRSVNLDKLNFVFYDIFFESQPKKYWDKINFIRQLKLNVPHYCFVRNIDSELLGHAIDEIGKSFNNGNITYPCYGFLLKVNKLVDEYGFLLNCINTDVNSNLIFSSMVKSVSIVGNKYYLNIVPVKCSNYISIDKIEITDVYDIEKQGIKIGSKIKFNVVEGKAYLK